MEQKKTIEDCYEIRQKALDALRAGKYSSSLDIEINDYDKKTLQYLDDLKSIMIVADNFGGNSVPIATSHYQQLIDDFYFTVEQTASVAKGVDDFPPPVDASKVVITDYEVLKKRMSANLLDMALNQEELFLFTALKSNEPGPYRGGGRH